MVETREKMTDWKERSSMNPQNMWKLNIIFGSKKMLLENIFVGHFSENGQCVSSLISEALQHRFLSDEDHVDDEQEDDEEKKY